MGIGPSNKFSLIGSNSPTDVPERIVNPEYSFTPDIPEFGQPTASVGNVLRQHAPSDDPGIDLSAIDQLMGEGPVQVPRPEGLKAPSVKDMIKRNLIGMIPFVGPAYQQAMTRRDEELASDWQRQQAEEDERFKRLSGVIDPALTDDLKKQLETRRKVQYAHYMKARFPNVSDTMLEANLAKTFGFDTNDRENVYVMLPWSQEPVPALQNALGEISYRGQDGRPTTGTPDSDPNIMKVLRPQDIKEAKEAKWESDRAQKWAFYNENVLRQGPDYQPTTLDYANAERFWDNSRARSETAARRREMIEARTGKPFEQTTSEERYKAELDDKIETSALRAEAGIMSVDTLNENGERVTMFVRKTPGSQYQRAKSEANLAEESAKNTLNVIIPRLKLWSEKLITEIGPSQRAKAMKQGAEAVLGNNPTYRAYVDIREAVGLSLASLLNRGRPSDKDLVAAMGYLPDVFKDTAESAPMKWETIEMFLDSSKMVYVTAEKGEKVIMIPLIHRDKYLEENRDEKEVVPKSQQ